VALQVDNSFLDALSSRLIEVNSFNKTTIFAVSTTAKKENSAYLTPIRVNENFVLAGCIIFDQKNLHSLLEKLDGEVDILLADSENPLPKRITKFNEKPDKKIDRTEDKTVSKICFKCIKESKIFEFKPNDITVNAAWSFLSQRLNYLSGSRVCILGAGNIGSKLALKLAECGAEVRVSRRNFQKGDHIVKGLNLIKPECSTPKICFYSDALEASLGVDVLIGTSSGSQIIDEDIVKRLDRECLIVDLGKNNLTENAIQTATENSMDIYRTDVTPAIESFVHELLKTNDILEYSCGVRELGFCRIVSGGFFGRKDDIVVDAIDNPKFVYGITQGNGLLKIVLSEEDECNIRRLKDALDID